MDSKHDTRIASPVGLWWVLLLPAHTGCARPHSLDEGDDDEFLCRVVPMGVSPYFGEKFAHPFRAN